MMKSTTTVVSKDSSLVVYTTTNIQSVSYYYFFSDFFALIFKHPVQRKNIQCFLSQEKRQQWVQTKLVQ